jgi:hypothetical protein
MDIKKIIVFLISIMLMASTPLVLAATEDNVVITFDPDGDIDINVDRTAYNFSSFVANTWSNSTGNWFTVYNNGTVAMDTSIKTNSSTDSGELDLNTSAAVPGQDEYAIYVQGLDNFDQYVNNTYTEYGYYDTALAPDDSENFDICLLLGTNLSTNHSWQMTTIYFQGSQS